MTHAIRLAGVTRGFGGKAVLRGVTAMAAAGKVIGLLGRNGEGKTTLFKILLDLLAADSGRVEVLGRVPDGSGALRQLVGFVPERPAYHPFMTIEEVLALRGRFFSSWSAEKARALARQLELDLATPVRGASKGTLGKLAWVCAAAHSPKLYLLDEPTSGLDALVREQMLDQLIGELHGTGATIVVANYRMEELAGVLDELWILAGGVIAGVYDMESLRAEACRITGRLKEGAVVPPELGVVGMNGVEAPLSAWAAFDRASAERFAAAGLCERLEKSPLPVESALKLLLKKEGV